MFGLGFRFPQLAAGGSSLAAQVRELFANGEQGGMWDFTSPEGLYQDSAGTTPVTAVGQPVGLMLDRRFGLERGAELSPAVDKPLWYENSASITSPGVFTTTAAGGIAFTAAEVGPMYELEVTWTTTATSLTIFTAVGGSVLAIGKSGTFKGIAATHSANRAFYLRNLDAGVATVSVSIRELPGNHLSQDTTAARPTYTVDGALHDGVDDRLFAADANDWTFLHDGTGGYMAASSEYREGGGTGASYFGTQTAAGLTIGASVGLQAMSLARTLSRMANGDEMAPGTTNTASGSFPIGLMGTQEFEVNTTGTRAWSRGELYRDEPFGDFMPSTAPPANPLTTQTTPAGTSVVHRRMLAISRTLTNDELALVRSWLMEGVE